MFPGQPTGTVASDLTIRIRARNGVEPQFLSAYLSFLYLSGYWKERAGGASGSMKKITRGQIQQEQVPVPALIEQRRIVEALQEQMASLEQIRTKLVMQKESISQLPGAILREAFNG